MAMENDQNQGDRGDVPLRYAKIREVSGINFDAEGAIHQEVKRSGNLFSASRRLCR